MKMTAEPENRTAHEKPLSLSKAASLDLDLVRGVAALLVVIGHWRYLFFTDYNGIAKPSAAVKAFYFVAGLGHQAVMAFFVLSGFLVGGTVIRSMREARWSWPRYLLDRGTRLYAVLLPALVLGLFWDSVGSAVFEGRGVYSGGSEYRAILPHPVQSSLNVRSFLGSLAFVQTILVAPFGTNGPLWSLANEFWYYIAFPLLWIAGVAKVSLQQKVMAALAGAAILIWVGLGIALYFAVWLMGVCLVLWPLPKSLQSPTSRWLGSALWLGSLTLHRTGHLGRVEIADLLLGIATSLWLGTLIGRQEESYSKSRRRLSRFLSETSYSCYLLHLPPMVFLAAWLVGDSRAGVSLKSVGVALSALGLVGVYVVVGWWLFECNTPLLRRWAYPRLVGDLGGNRASGATASVQVKGDN